MLGFTDEFMASSNSSTIIQSGKVYKIPRNSMSFKKVAEFSKMGNCDEALEIAIGYHDEIGRYMVIGTPEEVLLPKGSSRVIVHTHVNNKIRPTPQDIKMLNRYGQSRSFLINLKGKNSKYADIIEFYPNGDSYIRGIIKLDKGGLHVTLRNGK